MMDGVSCRILRLRGLPYSAEDDDVVQFFEGISVSQVYLLQRNGKPTGEAYVEFLDVEGAKEALEKRQRAHLGSRYIEIFDAEEANLVSSAFSGDSEPSLSGFIVRLRGLPFHSVAEDVLSFFHPLVPVGASSGVLFSCTHDGRSTGEAFINLATEEDFKAALNKNKQLLGSRYIETIESTKGELFHITHHRGFFNFLDGIKKYHGRPQSSSSNSTTDHYSVETSSTQSNLPRIRTSAFPRRDDMNLHQAFAGLGMSHPNHHRHHHQQQQQRQQQYYRAGAGGTVQHVNYNIGIPQHHGIHQIAIPQSHTAQGWLPIPQNRSGLIPPTSVNGAGAFSPTAGSGTGPLPGHHWDSRNPSTGSYTSTNTPPHAQQQSILMTPFVVHPFMTATPPTAPWGSPATATYVAVAPPPQQQQRQQQRQQQQGAMAWYGAQQGYIPGIRSGGGGSGGMSGHVPGQYPSFQGYNNMSNSNNSDGRSRYYARQQQQQQQGSLRPSPRSNHQYQHQSQQHQQQHLRGRDSLSNRTSASTSTRDTRVAKETAASTPEMAPQVPFLGTTDIIFGQGPPTSSADSVNSGDGLSSSSPPTD